MRLMTSVSGIRGIIGETLTPQVAVDAGCAFGAFLGGGTVVIGRDSRPSGDMVRSAVVVGLTASGCRVIDVGVCATPSTALTVTRHHAAGGVMITASHNPMPWNGIKFFGPDGAGPPEAVAQKILAILSDRRFKLVPTERVGTVSHDGSVHDYHVERVLSTVNGVTIRSRRFKVVLDSVNGGGAVAGRRLLESLGCDVVHLNDEPTGLFAHVPEPTRENLGELCARTPAERADVGFAQDPDADRLAIVDETGRYIGEEHTLVLAAEHVFATRPGPACANLSTSRMIDDLAARYPGCTVHRSAVGEANVAEVMRRHHCVIGGEGNGGVIDPRVVYVRDSLVAMAMVLQLMADEGKPLSRIVDELPRYVQIKHKFDCPDERVGPILDAVRQRFADQRINDADGIRIDWPCGWVHVRGSNTEPIMRIIAEAPDAFTAADLIRQVQVAISGL